MPADLAIGVRGVAVIPSDTIVYLGVPDSEADGVRLHGTFEVSGEGGKIGRRASTGTAGLRASRGGWGGGNTGSGGSSDGHRDDVLLKGSGLPGDGVILVVADLEREKDSRVHEGDVFSIGRAREVTVVKVFVAIVDPCVPRSRLTDTAINTEKHLNAFVIREDARAGRSESEEVVETGVESRDIEFVVGGF